MATPSAPEGGKISQFEPSVIQRVAGAVRYALTGKAPDWFGPQEPMSAQAPDDVKGRAMDYPAGVNLSYRPRSETQERSDLLGHDPFGTLRRAADPAQGGLDLLRLAVETRKDQMEAQRWAIRGKDGKDGGQRAKDLMAALRRPDLVDAFNVWARQIWEDMLVTDTACVYLRPMPEGFRIPEIMDGTTLKRLVDQTGRTPLPPQPAFQQILKGMPASDLTLDEVIYAPRNKRSYRFYGLSPVEQVVNFVVLALKRQQHLTAYYTDGNVPEHMVGVPPEWNPDQIQAAQDWMDGLMSNNLQARRKVLFVPGGMAPLPLKDPKLQDPLDEWLARVICWAFSLPPSALVKEVNRATAETAQEQGQQEGLEPLKIWWATFMNEVIARCWGVEDLEFVYEDEEISDPKVKMEYWTGWVNSKVVTPDEVREKVIGWEPLTPEQKLELNPPPPPGMGGDEMGGPGEPEKGPGKPQGAAGGKDSAPSKKLPPASEKAEKLEKKKPRLTPINRDRAAIRTAGRRIRKALMSYWKQQKAAVLAALSAPGRPLAKMDREEFLDLWGDLPMDAREELAEALVKILEDVADDGATVAVGQVLEFAGGAADAELDAMLSQANERAIEWARDRAAQLVGMRQDEEGNWIPNPNEQWQIDNTTRDAIRDLVAKAEEEGWSTDQLAEEIGGAACFEDARAEMVARTETAFADVAGNMEGYRASGLVQGKEWILGDDACEECVALSEMGPIPLNESFPGGYDGPPAHPNCRCDVIPVLTEEE